jgi:anti-sigma regulatory factor (Ser/Thr protein kinase)
MTTIKFPAELHVLPQGVTFVADYATATGCAPDRVAEIELAVGEVLTNICAYAYPTGGGDVEVQCAHNAGPRLCIDIVDSGVPFDPLAVPPPDLLAAPEERTTGGLGIFLLRSMVDEMTYRRDHDQNVLRLVIVPRP